MPATKVTPFLMFEGQAEEAMTLYTSLFPAAEITQIRRYGAGEMGAEGSVMHATFQLAGQSIQCSDSPVKHNFAFTPSTSLFVDCESIEQLESLFVQLSANGQVLMPVGDYGFSQRFAWVADRFGVSWQLNLPHRAS